MMKRISVALIGAVVLALCGCGLFMKAPIAIMRYERVSPARFEFRSASFDQDGAVSNIYWDFGDGITASGTQVAHAYLRTGAYTVVLTVTDDDGLTDSATREVWASHEIHVPGDRPTIQEGIAAAETGDTVMVAPGTYRERITFDGKTIEVRSTHGRALTIIEQRSPALPDSAGPVVCFDNSEGRDSVLRGFSIHGLRQATIYSGGGILLVGSSPTIADCAVRRFNAAQGGGVAAFESNALFVRCEISSCTAWLNGGGMYAAGTTAFPEIRTCTIHNNRAEAGGGIYLCAVEDCSLAPGALLPRITDCHFVGNVATGVLPRGPVGLGGAIHIGSGVYIFAAGNRFAANKPTDIGYDDAEH